MQQAALSTQRPVHRVTGGTRALKFSQPALASISSRRTAACRRRTATVCAAADKGLEAMLAPTLGINPTALEEEANKDPFGLAARIDLSNRLKLEQIRTQLLKQEDNIIFGWIKRSTYRRNLPCYQPGAMVTVMGSQSADPRVRTLSFLQWYLGEIETVHARIRRFTSPDEHPFFPERLPEPVLPPLTYLNSPLPRYADEININDKVMELYTGSVLPAITDEGDDNNYGSSVLNDAACLQALSKRIHFGKFVAEAKFRESREQFEPLIRAQDADGILQALTFPAQEAAVADRVARKTALFAESISEGGAPCRVTPDAVRRMWVEEIMPMTKVVQVKYLLRRLEPKETAPGKFAEGQARGTGPVGGFM